MPKIGAICLKRPLLLLQETHWRPPTSISKPELLEPQRCAKDKRGKVNSWPEKLWETHPREQICCVLHFFSFIFWKQFSAVVGWKSIRFTGCFCCCHSLEFCLGTNKGSSTFHSLFKLKYQGKCNLYTTARYLRSQPSVFWQVLGGWGHSIFNDTTRFITNALEYQKIKSKRFPKRSLQHKKYI